MKNNNPNAYNNIRRAFYARVKENEKNDKTKLIVILLATLLIASTLLFVAASVETSGGKYIFVYGDYTQRIDNNFAMSGKTRMIDLNALADYAQITKEPNGNKMTYSVNGTEASFENGSNIATINGLKVTMPAKASVKNGYCLIPFSTAESMLVGIKFNVEKKQIKANINSEDLFLVAKGFNLEYPGDISTYSKYINSSDSYIFTLVNKETPIDESFEPANLVVIPSQYSRKDKEIYLEATAMKALEAMLKAMKLEGIDDVYVQSSYRSHNYQSILFNTYVDNEMKKGLSEAQAIIKANKYSARPEHSEHRTGLCVDFTTSSIYGAVDDIFETTEAFDWLVDNSWKYGFVLRYPKDKTDITGYQYESWHYRFVGLERAAVMYQSGLCYEEYIEYFSN